MALTLTPVAGANFKDGNKRRRVYDVTFDSSFLSGGETLTAANVGMKKITEAIPHGAFRKTADNTDAILVSYDYTNSVLCAYDQKDPAATGGADIALPIVASTTDLSGYSGRITFLGW